MHLQQAGEGLAENLQGMFADRHALSGTEIADLIGFVTSRPRHVNLRQVMVLPTDQA